MGHSSLTERLPALKRFASILRDLPIPPAPARTLTLGCGAFPSYGMLYERWSHWLHIGLDYDLDELRFAPLAPLVHADAGHLPFGRSFALILVRHPDIARHREAWAVIMEGCSRVLAKGGLLVVTTYDLDEMDFARRHIALQRYPIDEGAFEPTDLSGQDRYVLAFRR